MRGELWETNPVYLEIVDFFASGTTPQTVVDLPTLVNFSAARPGIA